MFCILYHVFLPVLILGLSINLFIFIKKYNKWKFISCHDRLTGLLNREEFEHLLVKRMTFVKNNPEFMLIYCMIDLDDFKKINDLKGHKEGDRILKNVAKHLTYYIKSLKKDNCLLGENKKYPKICYMDILCRYGGEEFATVIISKRHTLDSSIEWEIDRACIKGGCAASVGSAIFLPNMDIHVKNLTENADFVMYTNKRRSKRKSSISEEELIKTCPEFEEYKPHDDRRKHKRIKVKGVICTFRFQNLSCFREETNFAGKILNISQGGLAFFSSVSNTNLMKVGIVIQIEYTLKGERYFHEIEIRHFNPSTNVCGGKFV